MIQFIKFKESNKKVDYLKYLKITKEFIETIDDDKLELYRYLALYTWYNMYILGEEKCFPCSNDILHPKNDDQIGISISDYEMTLFENDIIYIVLLDINENLPYLILNLINKCRYFNENKELTNN